MDVTAVAGGVVALVALAAATVVGLYWRRRDGRLRAVPAADRTAAALTALGARSGQVTVLHFSSAFCAPCRVARRVCAEVADAVDGVVALEVDAESHLDEVRRLGVWRTPTVLVVDTAGRVAYRATGAPGKAQLTAAVTPLLAVPA